MARNYAECQEMIAACEEAGVPLYVAYYCRAHPRFLKIKEFSIFGNDPVLLTAAKGTEQWSFEPL